MLRGRGPQGRSVPWGRARAQGRAVWSAGGKCGRRDDGAVLRVVLFRVRGEVLPQTWSQATWLSCRSEWARGRADSGALRPEVWVSGEESSALPAVLLRPTHAPCPRQPCQVPPTQRGPEVGASALRPAAPPLFCLGGPLPGSQLSSRCVLSRWRKPQGTGVSQGRRPCSGGPPLTAESPPPDTITVGGGVQHRHWRGADTQTQRALAHVAVEDTTKPRTQFEFSLVI